MRIRNCRLAAAAFLAGWVALFGASVRANVLFEVQVHFASGPVSLLIGQNASVCATNPDASPIAILIAVLTADNSSLLASNHVILQPGMGVCVPYTRTSPQLQQQQLAPNVYAVVVPNGRLDVNGRVVQDRRGSGGCIVASLQIQTPTLNNIPSQTIVYAQMVKHEHPGEQGANQNGGEGN